MELESQNLNPAKGPGERNFDCQFYGGCLGHAAKLDWQSFNCEKCAYLRPKTETCKVEGCENEVHARDLCMKHYKHALRNHRIEPDADEKKKRCKQCGELRWIESFRRWGNKYQNKRIDICANCVRENREKKKNMKASNQEAKKETVTLTINLTDYPEVAEALKEQARTNIRSIEHQALYIIVKALKEK
jgi:hypothetical protein